MPAVLITPMAGEACYSLLYGRIIFDHDSLAQITSIVYLLYGCQWNLSHPTEKEESHMQGHRDGPLPIPFLHPPRSLTQGNRLIPVPVRIPRLPHPCAKNRLRGSRFRFRAQPSIARKGGLSYALICTEKATGGAKRKGGGHPRQSVPFPPS